MLNILEQILPKGLAISSFKDLSSKYKLVFEFEGDKATAELRKACLPGCEYAMALDAIKTAMSTIYFNRGDYPKAKEWLDMKIGSYKIQSK